MYSSTSLPDLTDGESGLCCLNSTPRVDAQIRQPITLWGNLLKPLKQCRLQNNLALMPMAIHIPLSADA